MTVPTVMLKPSTSVHCDSFPACLGEEGKCTWLGLFKPKAFSRDVVQVAWLTSFWEALTSGGAQEKAVGLAAFPGLSWK